MVLTGRKWPVAVTDPDAFVTLPWTVLRVQPEPASAIQPGLIVALDISTGVAGGVHFRKGGRRREQ